MAHWWEDVRSLFTFATSSLEALDGMCATFELRIEGQPVLDSTSALVRVRVLQQMEASLENGSVVPHAASNPGHKAVLRVPLSTWFSLLQYSSIVRAVWTQVAVRDNIVVLDATQSPAWLAGDVTLRADETVRIAEIFAGGFAGWTQAAWCIKEGGGFPIQTSWLLDIDDDVIPPLQTMLPDLQVVSSAGELADASVDSVLLLSANFEHEWWLRVWGQFPPHIVVCSPPCQPWSGAGWQSGLDSPDGRLVLRVAALMGLVRVPLVCLEEVRSFRCHADFPQVLRAWEDSGYSLVYRGDLQLAEVAPTWRSRCFLVFACNDCPVVQSLHVPTAKWQPHPRPTLAAMHAYFPILPPGLLRPCQLSSEELEMYMDPWFLPPGRAQDQASIEQFRLCSPAQQAKTFMAAYHSQHNLPTRLLERGGLLCSLLRTTDSIRFFSAPEIASCHGAQGLHLLLKDDKTSMRIHGNALAVQQACLVLANTVQFLTEAIPLDPLQALDYCQANRTTSRNCAIFRMPGGWLLAHTKAVGRALAQDSLRKAIERRLQSSACRFHELHLESCSELGLPSVEVVYFTSHLNVQAVLDFLGLGEATADLVEDHDGEHCYHLQVPETLLIDLVALPRDRRQWQNPVLLCTPRLRVVLLLAVPGCFHQLKWVFDRCRGPLGLGVKCLDCFGTELPEVTAFPALTFVATEADDLFFPAALLDSDQVSHCRFTFAAKEIKLSVQPASAIAWWLQLPAHLCECLGWELLESGPIREDQPTVFCLKPSELVPPLPVQHLRPYFRDICWLAQLRQFGRTADAGLVGPFVMQVEGRTLCESCLSPALKVADIEQCWRVAGDAAGCWPVARIYSVPFFLDASLTLGQLCAEEGGPRVCRKGPGRLIAITVMPEVRGGTGSKDANFALAKSRVASLLLDQGVPLADTTVAVEQLVPALGATACLNALGSSDVQERWHALQSSAVRAGLTLPATVGATTRAAQRIQKAIRRRKLPQPAAVAACDFQLQPEDWCGMDEQAVPVLDAITPDCTGVILLDRNQADEQDLALLRNMGSEALCVVIPGHSCPDADTCNGRISIPVLHRSSGKHHLIAACYHNLGDTDIVPHCVHGSSVEVEGAVCCSFGMHSDECSGPEWQAAVRAPVRTVVDAFKANGLPQVLEHPWARSFRAAGRPANPPSCDSFLFYAKVAARDLKGLLQQSGFNRVYMVPRTWDRQVNADWSVVWLPGSKTDVEKQALLVSEHAGLVRGKNKFGLRVKQAHFQRVYRQLKPGMPVPEAVVVKAMYKVGPLPASANAEAVLSWAKQLSWPVRVLKTLGPQFWLLGAEHAPPATSAMFNGHRVLVSPVQPRAPQPPIVQAGGPVPRPAPKHTTTEEDPWTTNDPWRQYRDRTGNVAPGAPVPVVAPAKTIDQNLVARLHQQEERLALMESSIDQLREETAQAAKDRVADKLQFNQDLQGVRVEVQGLGNTLQQQFQAGVEALRAAQAQQDLQMNNGLAELKALMLANVDNKKARLHADNDL